MKPKALHYGTTRALCQNRASNKVTTDKFRVTCERCLREMSRILGVKAHELKGVRNVIGSERRLRVLGR